MINTGGNYKLSRQKMKSISFRLVLLFLICIRDIHHVGRDIQHNKHSVHYTNKTIGKFQTPPLQFQLLSLPHFFKTNIAMFCQSKIIFFLKSTCDVLLQFWPYCTKIQSTENQKVETTVPDISTVRREKMNSNAVTGIGLG